ncbi:electron transfer flavoprotein-ubiquinone oxidoreductase [Myxococcota bacterium]|nr:electron transfer flavoprotein-ubiquinone oxidoreductase [Myxococcota bacterium]
MERETMPVDVLFVGGGPACLAGAIHLMDLIGKHNETAPEDQKIQEPMIALIDKGSEIGAHAISGAVLDPKALAELIPDWDQREDFPLERRVEKESMQFLTKGSAFPAPIMPPFMQDHGLPIISIARFQKWLAGIAEEKGVMIFPGFAGVDIIWDESDPQRVAGVRTGDKGIDAHGEQKSNFEPGMNLEAKVTILGEGPRGHLVRVVNEKLGLDKDSQPQVYEIGCKEVLELPPGSVTKGEVTLMAGFPLDMDTFGGSFIYTMEGDKACIGLLVALDAKDPAMDCHYLLQKLKDHPFVRGKLKGGKVVKYGAKTVTVGGWASIPKLYGAGVMVVGDSASFLNPMRIKGIHLSMKSGMLAAETAFEALKSGDSSEKALAAFKEKIDQSWVKAEMEPAKNWHAAFKSGFIPGSFKAGMQYLFGPGRDITPFSPDFKGMQKAAAVHGSHPFPARDDLTYDGQYLIDKLTDVFMSGTKHDEHQPCHLIIQDTEICATRCKEEYGNPCERFCPAQVYNMVENEATGRKEMRVDFSNCVHCKTCDIRDPYQIIRWVPPEGGQGPEYGIL